MIISHKKGKYLYLIFQDFEDSIDEIYQELNKFPKLASKSIKEILDKNLFNINSIERQKNYINSISTYIDDITVNEEQYYFFLFIIPKDIDLKFKHIEEKYEQIEKIEELLIKLFKLYSSISPNKKLIELFENFSGTNFLQLESKFYISKLEKLYGTLLNYKKNYKNQVICSDKIIGVQIDELNMMENNPLKNYQLIKAPHQKELIKFIYSTIYFLKYFRLDIFKEKSPKEYEKIIKLINKIKNLLIMISTKKHILKETIDQNTLEKFLYKYKNRPEIKSNRNIFNLVNSIFFTQLKQDVQLFLSVDLTKIFEKIIEKKLSKYSEKLFIGNEDKGIIENYQTKLVEVDLNTCNSLFMPATKPNPIKQYPDFLVKDNLGQEDIYHIIDAKYKLEKNTLNPNDIRQVLIYAFLFNKKITIEQENQKYIKKIIIFAKKSVIDLDQINNIELNYDNIDILSEGISKDFTENIFGSKIQFIPITTIISRN